MVNLNKVYHYPISKQIKESNMMPKTYKQVNDAEFSKREAKQAKIEKPVSEEDKRKCEIRRKREELEEEIRLNKEFEL